MYTGHIKSRIWFHCYVAVQVASGCIAFTHLSTLSTKQQSSILFMFVTEVNNWYIHQFSQIHTPRIPLSKQ